MFRDEPDRLLALARRVASKLKRPYTLDPEDVVQDACVVLLQLEDSGLRPPDGWPDDTWWIVAARRELGGTKAYYTEWQWANRRWSGEVRAGESWAMPDGHQTSVSPEAGDSTLSPLSTREDAVAALIEHLPEIARLILNGTPKRDLWKRLGHAVARNLAADLEATMRNLDLWPAGRDQLCPRRAAK
jgi:hypothetical protein